ncbi:MAG: hypothetical protein ACE5HD_12115 [Acidobacteriota bacterium]
MLTGYNTDVNHAGQVFHVQTEDRGKENPLIETLIYVGGRILASRRRSYADQAGRKPSREDLADLIERQHQGVVRDIRLGKFDPPEQCKPFGEGIITDRSMDEVIREFIEESAANGTLPPPPTKGRPRKR